MPPVFVMHHRTQMVNVNLHADLIISQFHMPIYGKYYLNPRAVKRTNEA